MHPVSVPSPRPALRPFAPLRRARAVEAALDEAALRAERVRQGADVEVAVRLFADGSHVTVVRRTVPTPEGRRTIGIDAVVR